MSGRTRRGCNIVAHTAELLAAGDGGG